MRQVRLRFAIAICVVWILSFADAVVANGTVLFGFVTPVMLVVVTALYSFDKWKNGNGE